MMSADDEIKTNYFFTTKCLDKLSGSKRLLSILFKSSLFTISPILLMLAVRCIDTDIPIPSIYAGRVISIICALFWILVSPTLIYYFDQKTLKFFKDVISASNTNKEKVEKLFKCYVVANKRVTKFCAVVFTISITVVLLVFPNSLEAYGFGGINDLFHYAFIVYAVYVAQFVSYGISQIVSNVY